MKHRIKQQVCLLGVACLLTSGLALAKDVSDTPTVNEEISMVPAQVLTPSQQEILSHTAAQALRHIAAARGALHDKKTATAKQELQQVDTLLKILKTSRPVAKIEDHIWVAKKHLDYESAEEVSADLIPIYSDLTDLEDIVDVKQAKAHLDTTKKHLAANNKKAAKDELDVVDEEIMYTEVDLPLAETTRQVALAKKYLAKNKLTDADQALKEAEDGVQVLSVAVESPLSQAHRSLWQATKAMADKDYERARIELAKASTWIKRASQSSDKKIDKMANELMVSLKKLKNKLP